MFNFNFFSFDLQSLILAKNSTAFHYFVNPPLNPQLRVHIFNYTNTERFLRGDDKKLIVKDVGPYVYTERTKKVNVVYNDNNTISYQVYIIIDLFACLRTVICAFWSKPSAQSTGFSSNTFQVCAWCVFFLLCIHLKLFCLLRNIDRLTFVQSYQLALNSIHSLCRISHLCRPHGNWQEIKISSKTSLSEDSFLQRDPNRLW